LDNLAAQLIDKTKSQTIRCFHNHKGYERKISSHPILPEVLVSQEKVFQKECAEKVQANTQRIKKQKISPGERVRKA
jgi:hypothetical protein